MNMRDVTLVTPRRPDPGPAANHSNHAHACPGAEASRPPGIGAAVKIIIVNAPAAVQVTLAAWSSGTCSKKRGGGTNLAPR